MIDKSAKTVDWSSIVKIIYHAFLDEQFIEQLKYDYINQKTSEIYDKKLDTL